MDGNVCPECGGWGEVAGALLPSGGWDEPPDYADEPCPVCHGEGTITTPLTEEDMAGMKRVATTIWAESQTGGRRISRQDETENCVIVHATRDDGTDFTVCLRVNKNGAISLIGNEGRYQGKEVQLYRGRIGRDGTD